MHYPHRMKSSQTQSHLNEDFPDLDLLENILLPLMMLYFLEEVTVVRIFHHYTMRQNITKRGVLPQAVTGSINERLLVLYYVLVAAFNGCEDADLIHRILALLLCEPVHLHLLQGVFALVIPPEHLVDRGVSALAQLLNDREIVQSRRLLLLVVLVGWVPLRHVMHHYQLLLHFISSIIV